MTLDAASLPLSGIRVLDLCDGVGELASRFLGDLGADVIRVDRADNPHVPDVFFHATHNANKRSVQLDLSDEADLATFWDLAASAHIVFESSAPHDHDTNPVAPRTLRDRFPRLVVASLTPFGQSGPYRDWVATDAVYLAMSGVLSRSGLPDMDPLVPPGNLATESAAIQVAWSALLAYLNRLDTGAGDHVDASVFESTVQILDPGFGIGGSATGGVPAADGPRGRPDARHLYPIFRCADGWVRICILAPRQWQGMYTWLGQPKEFADPELASLPERFAAAGRIYPAIGRMFATKTRATITAGGQQHGVPTAALLEPTEVLTADHFHARGSFTTATVEGATVKLPNGLVEIDGHRAGLRSPAPVPGEHTDLVRTQLNSARVDATDKTAHNPKRRLPLKGIRVLDLGVIVVGAELGRLLADMGAEVIKVENTAFPDGSRQSMTGDPLTVSFAWGHRNKSSVGVNLREPHGLALFKELAAAADVILSNFKPGTLESLGIGYDVLSALNPGLVMADSSAFGPSGPWSRRMGYGPLVRAETGLSGLWRYPDVDGSYSDASTIYPDHVAARVGAVAVLALLLRRRRTGHGGTASVAQAEVILNQMATQLAAESSMPGTVQAVGNRLSGDAPRGVYPCAGDDEWCVVTVRSDADFTALAKVIDQPHLASDDRFSTAEGRQALRDELDAALTGWTSARSPHEAATALQRSGVPAGMMHRVTELLDDPHLAERRFFRSMTHPLLADVVPTENQPALFAHISDAPLRPAPLLGQQSRDLLHDTLGLPHERIAQLITDGIIEETLPNPAAATTALA
jgi:crotonobetainyl-CoA:carnitine CoA-transferase CaiB-like acyl-CoA transferase